MAGYSSQRDQLCDLESAFSIGNPDRCGGFTCVGHAPSQGRRCRNPIAAGNQIAARDILNQLSRMPPLEVSDTQTDRLREAAGYALCRRDHQNQADRVVREWKQILRGQVSWDGESSEERAASRNHIRSASRGDSGMVRLLASPSRSQEPHQRNSRHNGMNDRLSHAVDDMQDTRRVMTYHMETTHEAHRQAPSEGRTPGLPAVAVPAPQPTRQQTCSATHKSRRSIDEDCVICTMPMVNCSLSELVWCKSSCGRSVHRDCFETLRRHVDVTRCVFCRANWSGSCEHDEQRPQEFEMWADWEWGLDALFDQRV